MAGPANPPVAPSEGHLPTPPQPSGGKPEPTQPAVNQGGAQVGPPVGSVVIQQPDGSESVGYQLIPGSNVTLTPSGRTGTTIDSTGGAGSGVNLGTAPLHIFKDVAAGALRHRTMRIALDSARATPSSQQDPSGFDGEVWIRPVPPGHVNIVDYGALPSNQDGTGTITDCTAALQAAIAAVSTALPATNQPGIVYIPPAPNGQEWFFAGAATDMLPTKCVEISHCVHIMGVGTGYQRGGTRIKFGPLCSGFRFTAQTYSSDGGDSSGTIVEGLTIYNTPIASLTGSDAITIGWKHAHAYSVGDKIRPIRFQNLYYECVKAGTSGGPAPSIGDCSRFASVNLEGGTINRWAPGTTYMLGTKVYPNIACGSTFVCTSAGKTINHTYSEVTPSIGKYDGLGEPDWFTDPLNPSGSLIPTIIEPIDEDGNPGPQWQPSETDHEPLWEESNLGTLCYAKAYQTTHLYFYGSQVFATGRFDVLFICRTPDLHTPQLSGGSEPASFATAVIGDLITDGMLTWQCIAPIGLVTDGTCVWAARFAGAFIIDAPYITIKRPYVATQVDGTLNCPTAAFGLFSGIFGSTAAMNSDFTKVLGPGFVNGCGVCIYAHGPDSNAGVIKDIVFGGELFGEYGATGEHCVYDRSFLGNFYEGCVFNGASGWLFAALSQAGTSSLTDCYVEGAGLRRAPMYGPLSIRGGTVPFNAFRSSRNWQRSFLSTGSACIFADRSNALYGRGFHTNPKIEIVAGLQDTPQTAFFFQAHDVQNPGTGDDRDGYRFKYADFTGWWSFTHGDSQWAWHVAGDTADYTGGTFWLRHGFLLGTGGRHFYWADTASFFNDFYRAGVRSQSDFVDREVEAVTVGTYKQIVNIDGSGGKIGPYWAASTVHSLGDIVVPNAGHETAAHSAFQVTNTGAPPHQSGGSEPAWSDAGTTSDGNLTWTPIAGVDLRYTGLLEDSKVGRTIQTTTTWKDSADTAPTANAPKSYCQARRLQAQTTTNAASQVIDDGATNGLTTNEDLTLAADGTTVIDVTLTLKKHSAADAGSIKLSGTFYRNGAGAPVNVPTDDNVAKLSGGLAGTTAALIISGNAVQVQVSPGAAVTIDWGVTRLQTVRVS